MAKNDQKPSKYAFFEILCAIFSQNRIIWLGVVLSQYWELEAHTSGELTSTLGHHVILCVFRFKASFALFHGTVQNSSGLHLLGVILTILRPFWAEKKVRRGS